MSGRPTAAHSERLCRFEPYTSITDCSLPPAEFARACAALCRRFGVPLDILAVSVDTSRGESLEAAARDARYAALERDLGENECLLTAHHALDQAETLLLQLLRGAGLKGMSAMPFCRPLGRGWHVRPLLDVAKRDLVAFGAAADLASVDDPMNGDTRFDRTYLRAQIWPLLEQRWPGVAPALSRAARHVAESQALLDESALRELRSLRDGDALAVTGLRGLPAIQQRNVLRHWMAVRDVKPPSSARLSEALRQILDAGEDHLPCVVWGDHALRRYRDRVFLTAACPPCVPERLAWPHEAGDSANGGVMRALELGAGLGTLHWVPRSGGLDAARLPAVLSVRRREGGESLKPHARAATRSVQHLCQSVGLLPWMRDALPLVYAGKALVAVGDLWQDARWCVEAGATGVGCVWENAPLLM